VDAEPISGDGSAYVLFRIARARSQRLSSRYLRTSSSVVVVFVVVFALFLSVRGSGALSRASPGVSSLRGVSAFLETISDFSTLAALEVRGIRLGGEPAQVAPASAGASAPDAACGDASARSRRVVDAAGRGGFVRRDRETGAARPAPRVR
jgi:hypothetical protein